MGCKKEAAAVVICSMIVGYGRERFETRGERHDGFEGVQKHAVHAC